MTPYVYVNLLRVELVVPTTDWPRVATISVSVRKAISLASSATVPG
jgi:hypothetical protein